LFTLTNHEHSKAPHVEAMEGLSAVDREFYVMQASDAEVARLGGGVRV
jgi:hypothetical protein